MLKIPLDMISGTVHKSNQFGTIEIVKYTRKEVVRILFHNTGYISNASSSNIRRGEVKDNMAPTVLNFGFIGDGKYSPSNSKESYSRWKDMLTRCYCPLFLNEHRTYIDCFVCDEWLNFQNFSEWMYSQDYKGKELDKDLSVIGNKIYSPEFCEFIPKGINSLIPDSSSIRGSSPLGVHWDCNRNKFTSQIKINGRHKLIGRYDCEYRAHLEYAKLRSSYIAEKANKSLESNLISESVFNGLLMYSHSLISTALALYHSRR